MAEPMLTVSKVSGDPVAEKTVAQLTEALVAAGVQVPAGARKAALVELVERHKRNIDGAGGDK